MKGLTQEWPYVAVWLFFLTGAMLRGTALYWLGRGARVGGDRRGLTERPFVVRAERLVERYGAPVIPLAFLTVGVQSAVTIAAGILRMPGRVFVPALLVGAMIWATIYTTIGMAALYALVGRSDRHWVAAAVAALAVIGAATLWGRRRVNRTGADEAAGDATSDRV